MIYYFCYMKDIGTNIRRLRKAKGLSQVELASMLNATQKVVTSYENNQHRPTLEKLERLADIFEVSLDELAGRKKIKIQPEKPRVHRNSRTVKVQELFEKLPPLQQRAILQQIKALTESNK